MKKNMILVAIIFATPFLTGVRFINNTNRVDGSAFQGYELIARSCKDISCVQQNIQLIDTQIADLLARRLAFVKRGAQLKNSAVVPDHTHLNPNMIPEVTRQAQVQGFPPEVAQSVFKEIDRQSLEFEKKFQNTIPPIGNPNSFSNTTPDALNPVLTPTIVPE